MVNASRRKGVNLEGLALLPEGAGWLMVEFGADTADEAEAQARHLMEALDRSPAAPSMRLFTDPRLARRIWDVRESSLGVTSHVPGEPLRWEGFEDSAVAPEKLGAYLRDLRRLMQDFHYDGSFYGHFGHACVHTRMDYDLESAEGVRKFRQFMEEAADLVVRYGGSLSGEHGDGQARGELLPKMFGPELMQAFREFKSIWDPDWKMNPGKLIEPYRLDENLRLGAGYDPWQPETHFKFPDDHGSLAAATLRCVGVGKCRRDRGGVMCPSYRATRDEEHSTRGRAHLLWEMTKRDVIQDGWQNEAVKESLDLCLACKGCKSDCPVGVDVATYKAEFLSHYYETNRRPLKELGLSNIDLWLRAASHMPGLVNLTTQLPGLRELAKLAASIPAQRRIPALAPETFKQWWERQYPRRDGRIRPSSGAQRREGQAVLLWADTFNNHFLPATAKAAAEVLEAAGFDVSVPRAHLCCGRPLYDIGALDRAKALLLQIMDELLPEIEAAHAHRRPRTELRFGLPRRTYEPFPQRRARASALKAGFSAQRISRAAGQRMFPLPKLARRALIHGHCHHKAIMKMTAEEAVLRAHGRRLHRSRPRMLRHGGSVRLRKREVRHFESHRRTGTAARRPPGSDRLAHRCRRFQLPRADRPGDRPPRAAPGRSSPDGPARSYRNPRRLPDVRPRAATLSRRRLGAASPGRHREIHEANRAGRGGDRGRSGVAVGAGPKALKHVWGRASRESPERSLASDGQRSRRARYTGRSCHRALTHSARRNLVNVSTEI